MTQEDKSIKGMVLNSYAYNPESGSPGKLIVSVLPDGSDAEIIVWPISKISKELPSWWVGINLDTIKGKTIQAWYSYTKLYNNTPQYTASRISILPEFFVEETTVEEEESIPEADFVMAPVPTLPVPSIETEAIARSHNPAARADTQRDSIERQVAAKCAPDLCLGAEGPAPFDRDWDGWFYHIIARIQNTPAPTDRE